MEDLGALGAIAELHGRFAARREEGTVGWDADLGAWAAYGYAEARRVLSDWQVFSSARAAPRTDPRPSLLATDPPRHTQLRALLAPEFTPRAVATLEPRIRALVDALLEPALQKDGLELVAELAHPLPITVIAELLGVPASDRPLFRGWADAIVGQPGSPLLRGNEPTPEACAARDEMDAYFRRASAGRSGAPDLLGALVDARVDGAGLSEPELLAFCGLLLLAGHITTVNLVTNAVFNLLEHRDALEAVLTDPALVPGAVEETLRTLPPVRGVGRVATCPVELGGVQIREGQRVIAWIAAANRDERVFPFPDRFDVRRRPNPHLAFGMGPHFCLGAPLARLEARIALDALAPHLPGLAFSAADPPRLVRSGLLLGFSHLRLDAV